MKQKIGFIGIIQLVCGALSGIISLSVLISQESLTVVSFVRWFIFVYVMLMLLSSMFYESVRMKHEGKERKTLAILVLQILLFLCMAVASYRETLWIVLTYAIYVVGNLLVIFVINRASILKKKYWLCTIVIIYCLVFAIGR